MRAILFFIVAAASGFAQFSAHAAPGLAEFEYSDVLGGQTLPTDLTTLSPRDVVEKIAREVKFQVYPGILRGPSLTWSGRSGNSADQAVLLASVLKAQGVEVRLAGASIPEGEVQVFLLEKFWKDWAAWKDARREEVLDLARARPDDGRAEGVKTPDRQWWDDQFDDLYPPGEWPEGQKPEEEYEEGLRGNGQTELRELRTQFLQEVDRLVRQGRRWTGGSAREARTINWANELGWHVWVQKKSASGSWEDLDPVLQGRFRLVPQVVVSLNAIPREWFHSVELDVQVTFQIKDEQRTESYLRLKTDSATLGGRAIYLIHPGEGDGLFESGGFGRKLGAGFGGAEGGIPQVPVFRVGGITPRDFEGRVLKKDGWKGGDLFGGCGFFGCKPSIVSEILKIKIEGPKVGSITPFKGWESEREIFDLAGRAQRKKPGTEWQLHPFTTRGDQPAELQRIWAFETLTTDTSLDRISRPLETARDSRLGYLDRQARIIESWHSAEAGARALWKDGATLGYAATPGMAAMTLGVSRGAEPQAEDAAFEVADTWTALGLDLIHWDPRVPEASNNVTDSGLFKTAFEQVYWSWLVGAESAPEANPEVELLTALNIFSKNELAGESLVHLTPNHSALNALPADVRAAVQSDLESGDVWTFARGAEFYESRWFAWFTIDRETGVVVDRVEGAGHGTISEYIQKAESILSKVDTVCQYRKCLEAALAAARGVAYIVRGRVSATVGKDLKAVVSSASNCKGMILRVKMFKRWKNRGDVNEKVGAMKNAARSGKLKTPKRESYEGDRAKDPAEFAGRPAGPNKDWDHKVELACGGKHVAENVWALDSSINRSIGAVIGRSCGKLCEGTKIKDIVIDWVLK